MVGSFMSHDRFIEMARRQGLMISKISRFRVYFDDQQKAASVTGVDPSWTLAKSAGEKLTGKRLDIYRQGTTLAQTLEMRDPIGSILILHSRTRLELKQQAKELYQTLKVKDFGDEAKTSESLEVTARKDETNEDLAGRCLRQIRAALLDHQGSIEACEGKNDRNLRHKIKVTVYIK